MFTVAGWVNQRQNHAMDCLLEENKILLEQLAGKPRPFTDSKRKRFAVKAAEIGRKELDR